MSKGKYFLGELDGSCEDLFVYIKRLDKAKVDRGNKIDYAVFDEKGNQHLFKDKLPRKVVLASSLVVVFNPRRAKRPQFSESKELKSKRFTLKTILGDLRPHFSWRGPSGYKWDVCLNRYPILPQEFGLFGNKPFNCLVVRSDRFVHQRGMRRPENLLDLLTLLTQINHSASLKPPEFRLGINGWYYSNDKKESRTATLSQAHGQIIRFDFPIEKSRVKKLGVIGNVKVSTLCEPEWGTGFVLETSIFQLSRLAILTSRIIEEIIKEGNSFTVFGATKGNMLRVVVVGRPIARPGSYFTNGWSFSEIARVPILDASCDFYELRENNRVRARTDLFKRAQKSLQEITLPQSRLTAIFKKLNI